MALNNTPGFGRGATGKGILVPKVRESVQEEEEEQSEEEQAEQSEEEQPEEEQPVEEQVEQSEDQPEPVQEVVQEEVNNVEENSTEVTSQNQSDLEERVKVLEERLESLVNVFLNNNFTPIHKNICAKLNEI